MDTDPTSQLTDEALDAIEADGPTCLWSDDFYRLIADLRFTRSEVDRLKASPSRQEWFNRLNSWVRRLK